MKDKIALIMLTTFLCFAPVSQAEENTIGSQYDHWQKGIITCLPQQIVHGWACGNDTKSYLFEDYVTKAMEANGIDANVRVTGLEYMGDKGILIHYVYQKK